MKIFQLLDLIIRLFRLNKDNKAKAIIFGLLSYHAQVQSQIASAFWLGTSEEIEIPCDDNYDKVSLLLHMDGIHNSTVFLDNSVNDFVVTPSGNARISNAQSVFGGTSASFDGTGDFLTITSNTAFNYSTGDFTIEGWIRNAAATTTRRTIFSQSSGTSVSGLIIETYATGIETNRVYFGGYSSGTTVFNLNSIEIAASTWFHFAAVKSGTTYSLYINGVLQQSSTTATVIPYDNKNVVIGALTDNTGRDYFGFIDEVRITKGLARYTSNFTVPTAAFENADCPGPTGISVDYLVVAGGGGTGPFSGGAGAGGYRSSYGAVTGGGLPAENPIIANVGDVFTVTVGLGAPANQANPPAPGGNSVFSSITSLGGGSVNPQTTSSGNGSSGGSGAGARVGSGTSFTGGAGTVGQGYNGGNNGGAPNYGGGGGGGAGQAGANGTTTTGGKGGDGVQNSITGTAIYYAGGGGAGTFQGGTAGLGGLGGGGNAGAGGTNNAGSPGVDGLGGGAGSGSYQTSAGSGAKGGNGVVIIRLDDAYDIITTSGNLVLEKSIVAGNRVVKFTSGSGTIEFVDGTCDQYFYSNSLLLHMDGANSSTTFTDNSINNFTVTPVGNAQISTAQSKFNGASGYFDGSGDYLSITTDAAFQFGTGDFTVEAWVYLTANMIGSSGGYLTDFRGGSSNNFALGFIGNAGVTKMYQYANNAGVMGSGIVTLNTWNHVAYVRNNSTVTMYLNGTSNGTFTSSYSQNITNVIIMSRYTGTQEYVTGYIDDLRITKGVARYTSNFTPPTAPFEDNSCTDFWNGTQTGILDDYPGAAAAYSVRALSSNYTGPLMTIRRASDNKEKNVYALASGDLDVALINSFCLGSSCTVKTWYDQSGNNYNLSVSGSSPFIYTNGEIVKTGNNTAIQFATTNTNQNVNFVNTSLILTQPYTIFGIAERISNVDRQIIISSNIYSGTNLTNFGYTDVTVNEISIYSGTRLLSNNTITNQRFVLAGLYNGVNSSTRFNNNIVNTGNAGTNNINGIAIGGLPIAVSNEYAFVGKISEIIIYNTNFSSNYNAMFSNINSYYSIY